MLKLFVVDDEDIIRAGIRVSVERMEGRYTICGEAEDGEMAIPLIQELKPDIIIADVRMPFMDGLELATLVRRNMPWIHVVIVSGHDEFQYAQRAVSIGVDAYILKPINSLKLAEVLDGVAARIEVEKRSFLELEEAPKQRELEQTVLREHFLSRLVVGAVTTKEVLSFATRQNIDLLAPCYVVCSAELSGIEGDGLTSLRLLGNRLFAGRSDVIWFLKGVDRLVFIVKGAEEQALQEAAFETARTLRHELERFLALDTAVGIGSIVDGIEALSRSYDDACSVFFRGLRFRGDKIIGFSDLQHERITLRRDLSAEAPLADRLRHATREDLPQILDGHFRDSGGPEGDSILFRYYLLMDAVMTAIRLCNELDPGSPDQVENLGGMLEAAACQEQAKEVALSFMGRFLDLRDSGGHLPYGREIRQAREYIDAHCGDASLSLHSVARHIGFSPNHFSSVFSQETGRTFIEYLSQRRMAAARELLENSDLKLQEIAYRVGYNDPGYFSNVFKRHTGVSPRDYRRSIAHGQ